MQKVIPSFAIILLFGCIKTQAQTIQPDANNVLYVNSTAAPGGDGSSWANAIPQLADALTWARQQHDANNNWLQNDSLRIFIADGTYKPLYNAADGSYTTDGGRDNAFVMIENVQLYGGFPNTGNPGFDDRDWNANPTILSGDIGIANDNSDNTYHVVISCDYVGNASLNGLTISGGNANGSFSIIVNGLGASRRYGGGILNSSSSPAILNTSISNNSANYGGGISNSYSTSSPTILNTSISNNSALNGGGMFNLGSSPTILNTCISNNSANYGGGIGNSTASPTISNTTISNNSAQIGGDGMYNESTSPVVNNSIVFGNKLADASVSNILNENASTPVFKYSLIGGATSWNASWGVDSGNNIVTTSNPFADTASADFSLNPGTAAINSGSNTLYTDAGGDLDNDMDLAGNTRVYELVGGGIVDMGAYEFQDHPLPVKMGPLNGLVNQNDHTILSWNTFSESNNKGFQIQHSVDGIHFMNDTFIDSKATRGNSGSPLNYSVDMGLLTGTRYYRFLQIDIEGRKSYSNIVRVHLLKKELDCLLYPNPANQIITFSVMDNPGGFIHVLNQHGQVLKKMEIKSSTTKIDLKDLPPGSYLLLYLNSGKQIERKFIKI